MYKKYSEICIEEDMYNVNCVEKYSGTLQINKPAKT
jgi:hypothetical protein